MAETPGATSDGRTLLDVPIGSLLPGEGQPRQIFDEEALAGLAASIRVHGLLQPLLVTAERHPGGEDRYRIVAGERRWRAAALARLARVPVLVLAIDDRLRQEVALIENLQRSDLRPLELAQAFQAILKRTGMTHEELADRLGKARVSITNTLRLLGLGYAAQQALNEGRISEGHGRALLGLAGSAQDQALAEILAHDLTVRQTEALVRRMAAPRRPAAQVSGEGLRVLEDALRTVLGAKVAVSGSDHAGRIVIEYHSREELERLCQQIGGEDLAHELG